MQQQAERAFADYKFISLPNLSVVRRPPPSRELVSTEVKPGCSESHLLVALARCLGAYCSSSDIVLGWQPIERRSDSTQNRQFMAARVNWTNAASWSALLGGIVLADPGEEPSKVNDALGVELDEGQNLYLAIVSSNLDYDHPLVVSLDGESNTVWLKYSTLSFHKSTAEVLAAHVSAVIAQIIEYPDGRPRSLSFLPRSLLSIVQQRADGTSYTHLPQARFVTDYITEHDTSVVALEYCSDLFDEDGSETCMRQLTYGELRARSNQFAAYLLAKGLAQEERVALCMLRGIEFHVCMLAVLKAGGCYVPIDAELPKERQNFIQQDSAARFVFTSSNIHEHIQASSTYSTDDINIARPEGLAYLLYTSGTTGTPKGCLLTHDGLTQAIQALSWFTNQAGPNKRTWPQQGRYLALASIAFDVHLSETFVTFALGMTLVSAPRAQLLEDLPHWLAELRITHVGIVPSLIEATMLAVAESVDDDGSSSMDLAYIASGGEKMSDSILDRWADHPSVILANFYGPSEVTIGCAARLMTSTTRKENIGRIFENSSAYVIDENLEVVIRGGVGELLVGGRLVGRGYHGRPDLTQKAFIDWDGGKAYRTGDLVRLMPDDTLEILGRIDTQIKLRGVRIEAEGISSVVRNAAKAFPGLPTNCAPDVSTILTRHPLLNTDQLVSFIAWNPSVTIAHRRSSTPNVLRSAPPGFMKALKDATSRELASYMRPAHIVPLDFLPLNQNGKTDSKVLIKVFQESDLETLAKAGAQAENVDVDSTAREMNETERKLAELLARYTAIPPERMKPSTNVFELALDSLKLVRLASDIRSTFSLPSSALPFNEIMLDPILERLSVLVEEALRTHVTGSTTSSSSSSLEYEQRHIEEIRQTVDAGAIERVLPTFPVQDGVLYRSTESEALYVQYVVFELNADVQIENMKAAWQTLMTRHEILRTTFHFSTEISQIVLHANSCALPWVERYLQGDGLEVSHSFSDLFLKSDARELAYDINTNISKKPPFRLVVYHTKSGTTYLTLSIHHSVYDGVSLPMLLQDVENLYMNEDLSSSAPLWKVLDAIHDVDPEKAAQTWRNIFEGFDWSQIRGRTASGRNAETYSLTLDGNIGLWEGRAARAKVSLQALLMSSFGVCLCRHLYGTSDVAFGVIRSGRSFPDEDMNVARCPLLTIIPARVNTKIRDTLNVVQRDISLVLPFQSIPLSRIQRWLRPGNALFEVLFSMTNKSGSESRIWKVVESVQPQADYILAVEVMIDDKTGEIRVDSAFTSPLSASFLDTLLRDFESTAVSLARDNSSSGQYERTKNPSRPLVDDLIDEFSDSESSEEQPGDLELEGKIRTVVTEFLRIDSANVHPTSSLIALGLDSIKSVGLSRHLKQKNINISAVEIMQNPSVRRMAARHGGRRTSSRQEENDARIILDESRNSIEQNLDKRTILLDESDNVDLYPVTDLQAGMLSQTISSGGRLYMHTFPFRLSESVDIERLREAWCKVVKRFASLRTSFHYLDKVGIWIQAVHSSFVPAWNEDDVGVNSPSTDFSSESAFEKPPVFLRLCQEAEIHGETLSRTLILVIHHALYDGISISVLSDALNAFYRGQEPVSSCQYVDLLGSLKYQERHGTEFWTSQLRGFAPPTSLRNVTLGFGARATLMTKNIPLSSKRMSEACNTFKVTAQCFGQAAVAKLLSKLYETADIVFGHVVSGRNIPNAENVMGLLINTVPIRVRLSNDLSNLRLVRSIQHNNTKALRWQHASLRAIQRELRLGSLWDCVFTFQPLEEHDIPEVDHLWRFEAPVDEVAKIQYPLNIEIHQGRDQLVVIGASLTDVIDEVKLHLLLNEFASDILDIINHPSSYAMPTIPASGHSNVEPAPHSAHASAEAKCTIKPTRVEDSQMKLLLEILATATKVPLAQMDAESRLISLGVDSISAIQISSLARKGGLKIHATDLLRCQTPSEVLNLANRAISKKKAVRMQEPKLHVPSNIYMALLQRLRADKNVIEGVYQASPGMKWLIGMWQLSNRALFQHAFAFELRRSVDENQLQRAWRDLSRIHAILRSTFVTSEASSLHIVTFKDLPADRLWSIENFDDGTSPDHGTVAKFMEGLVSSPLSTDRPPVRAIFLRSNLSNYLVMHLHHFMYDAWSMRLLIDGLTRLYEGQKTESRKDLETFLQACIPTSSQTQQQREYWQSYLGTSFEPSLLTRLHNKRESERHVFTKRKSLSNVPQLKRRANAMGLSLNAVFLGCWAHVQAECSRTHSATFGLWHLGRAGGLDDITGLAVPCINVLPVHVDVGTSIEQVCGRLQTVLRERSPVIEQSDLEDVNRWTRNGRRDALYNVFINIIILPTVKGYDEGNLLTPVNIPYHIPKVPHTEVHPTAERLAVCDLMRNDVMVDIVADEKQVDISIEYSDEYLNDAKSQWLAERWAKQVYEVLGGYGSCICL